MRMNKHAKILDLVVLVVVVLFVWMNPFDIHLIKVVSAFRPKKPPANLPPGFFGTPNPVDQNVSSVGFEAAQGARAAYGLAADDGCPRLHQYFLGRQHPGSATRAAAET